MIQNSTHFFFFSYDIRLHRNFIYVTQKFSGPNLYLKFNFIMGVSTKRLILCECSKFLHFSTFCRYVCTFFYFGSNFFFVSLGTHYFVFIEYSKKVTQHLI